MHSRPSSSSSLPSVSLQSRSESQPVPRRKSPAPSFINLDDCKPILHTTTTNTSTNSSSNGAKAFVFTSSRTLRALQKQEGRGPHPLSPGSSVASSPGTPPTPSSASSAGRPRAQLTLSQLTKHSEGAIDARSLIGPKMREAGFVNLPHTLNSYSNCNSPGESMSIPVSALLQPTPSNPPNFPPIVFLHPTVATTLPMWDYQNDPRWSFNISTGRGVYAPAQVIASSNEPTPGTGEAGPSCFFSPSATHPARRVGMPASSGSSSSDSLGPLSSSGSSTLVSSGSSPSTGLSSVEEADEDEGKAKGYCKGKIKTLEMEPSEYPFPPTYDHPVSPTSCGSRGSHRSRASSATASPTATVYAGPTVSSANPLTPSRPITDPFLPSSYREAPPAEKRPSPPKSRRSSGEKFDKSERAKPKKSVAAPTPTFATAPRRPGYQRQYSLTELCDSSPFVWLTKSDVFPPPAPISRSPIRPSSIAPSSLSASMSRPRAVVEAPPHRRHHTAPEKIPTLHSERHHRIASAPLRRPAISSDNGSPDQDSEKAGAKRGNKTRDQATHAPPDMDSSSTFTGGATEGHRLGDGMSAPAPSQGSGGLRERERGRDPRGKLLGASQTVEERTAVETELELERAQDGLAALMLAHRERDQEYARHVAADRARDKLVKQKQRVHHKLRGKLIQDDDPSESEITMVDQQVSVVKPVN
ncbi:hypothetical protein BD414DRAFT_541357 [Trametes punicea]|nr:hypothetical protein BD414DRAFT_541357 [Trametes punicea]